MVIEIKGRICPVCDKPIPNSRYITAKYCSPQCTWMSVELRRKRVPFYRRLAEQINWDKKDPINKTPFELHGSSFHI